MAKRRAGGVNKSEKVREYITSNPDAAPKDVVAAMTEAGISVSSQLVSNIKTRMTGKKRRKKRRKTVAAANGGAARGRPRKSKSGYEALFDAKAFVAKAGSVAAARDALDALARLQ